MDEENFEDNQTETTSQYNEIGGMCVRGKDLYRKFEDLIAKDQIKIG